MRAAALRVAVVGAGPAGMYSVGHLIERAGPSVEIDLYEKLPCPWGLVRTGVAPDHPEKKLVIDRLFAHHLKAAQVRFLGNVEIGRDLRSSELGQFYDAVIYATGAAGDFRIGIPGEELPGCWSARQFVAYYNGDPDFSHLKFDLSGRRAVIVGNGNVALDIARILTLPVAALQRTDIADHALEALRRSGVREVLILGRRGPRQAAFSSAELEELEYLTAVDIVVAGQNVEDDQNVDDGQEGAQDADDHRLRRKLQILRRLSARPRHESHKRIVFQFLTSPIELSGDGKVRRLRVARNRLERHGREDWQAHPTSEVTSLDVGIVFRSLGYRGTRFPELPFDERQGVIANEDGRVIDHGQAIPGTYVVGWIKRGCRGIIGSNKKCADQTIRCLFEDVAAGRLRKSAMNPDDLLALVRRRKPDILLLEGWRAIDHWEREAGRADGRPRVKLTTVDRLLAGAAARI